MIGEIDASEVPYLTTDQMIEVDRAMMEDYRIDLIQMMENAGRCLAIVARDRFLDGSPIGKRVTVLAGRGGNGGGALVASRRLHNWGATVRVVLGQADESMTDVPGHQLDILRRMSLDIVTGTEIAEAGVGDLIIDGLIGYSLRGNPRGVVGDLIQWGNAQAAPILSLDAPSGIDATSGTVFDPAVRATATMTLALPKEGLRATGVDTHVGELYLADISVPPELYQGPGLGIAVGPIFAKNDVVRLR